MTRPIILGFGLVIAMLVPHFGDVMGFIGSFSGTCLSFILPCVFYMKIHWRKTKMHEIILCCCIIVFGVVAGVTGMVYAARKLVTSFAF